MLPIQHLIEISPGIIRPWRREKRKVHKGSSSANRRRSMRDRLTESAMPSGWLPSGRSCRQDAKEGRNTSSRRSMLSGRRRQQQETLVVNDTGGFESTQGSRLHADGMDALSIRGDRHEAVDRRIDTMKMDSMLTKARR